MQVEVPIQEPKFEVWKNCRSGSEVELMPTRTPCLPGRRRALARTQDPRSRHSARGGKYLRCNLGSCHAVLEHCFFIQETVKFSLTAEKVVPIRISVHLFFSGGGFFDAIEACRFSGASWKGLRRGAREGGGPGLPSPTTAGAQPQN